MSRFRFVDDHRGLYEVKRLCRLVEVSRAGYYAWRERPASPRALADAGLVAVIVEIHSHSRGTYGRPRITGQLRHRGFCVNHKRVARLMRAGRPGGLSNRRRWRRGQDRPARRRRIFSSGTSPPRARTSGGWPTSPSSTPTTDGSISPASWTSTPAGSWGGRWDRDATPNSSSTRWPWPSPGVDHRRRVVHHADRGSQYTSMAFCDSALDAKVAL